MNIIFMKLSTTSRDLPQQMELISETWLQQISWTCCGGRFCQRHYYIMNKNVLHLLCRDECQTFYYVTLVMLLYVLIQYSRSPKGTSLRHYSKLSFAAGHLRHHLSPLIKLI